MRRSQIIKLHFTQGDSIRTAVSRWVRRPGYLWRLINAYYQISQPEQHWGTNIAQYGAPVLAFTATEPPASPDGDWSLSEQIMAAASITDSYSAVSSVDSAGQTHYKSYDARAVHGNIFVGFDRHDIFADELYLSAFADRGFSYAADVRVRAVAEEVQATDNLYFGFQCCKK